MNLPRSLKLLCRAPVMQITSLAITLQSLAPTLVTQDLQTWKNLYGRHLEYFYFTEQKGFSLVLTFGFVLASDCTPWEKVRRKKPAASASWDPLESFFFFFYSLNSCIAKIYIQPLSRQHAGREQMSENCISMQGHTEIHGAYCYLLSWTPTRRVSCSLGLFCEV